jgi:hypothetical protein
MRDDKLSEYTGAIEYDPTPVRCVWEALHPIVWQGRQWAVTEYGIECRDGRYTIDKARLGEFHSSWSWVKQLGEKPWVDVADFTTAYLVALTVHRISLSKEKLQLAINHCEKFVEETSDE